jgi:AraC-like DNA-binding protein
MAHRPTSKSGEWSRYYRLSICNSIEALHARFVTHRYARHSHDYLVIGVIERGAQAYWYRGARHVTPEGRVFLVNPGEPHTGESATSQGYVYRTLNPSQELLAQVARDVGATGVPRFKGAVLNDPVLVRMLSSVHGCLIEQGSKSETEIQIIGVIAHLIRHYSDTSAATKPIENERQAVRRARDYLEARFSEDVSLSELAAVVALSPFYFARVFHRDVGMPPHAYLEGVRIRKARDCLDRGDDLASTALAVGYSDQTHFTRRFKRFLGITPGQYLRESKIRQDEGAIAWHATQGDEHVTGVS